MRTKGWSLIVAVATMCMGGCDSQPAGTGEQFVRDQEGIITSHGRIEPTSVQANGNLIHYQTADGRTWQVSKTDRPDGTRDYGIPEEVPAAKK